METVTFGGNPVHTNGNLPAIGSPLPPFTLVGHDLADITGQDFPGKRIVLNIFPSLDTGTCAMSVRRFNQMAAAWPDTVVVCVSKDLPFAQSRFCVTEGIENLVTASAFRSSFGDDYGITMVDGPLSGLLARCVVVADPSGSIAYTNITPVIEEEPDYEAAAAAVLG
ncbi:MAG: thiol peroxidase [Propionibacteriaceae bacterium]|jgi:thiol peroxidase|nr:thiol peroxidase [Propionibacteriaceae bacterium]